MSVARYVLKRKSNHLFEGSTGLVIPLLENYLKEVVKKYVDRSS